MATLIIYLCVFANALIALYRPWVGIITGYLFVVLGPQYIWWWHLQGIRVFLYVVVPTLVGFVINVILGRVHFNCFFSKINICMILLWVSFVLSYYLGAYVDISSSYRFHDPENILSLVNNIFLFYFVASILISDIPKLKWLVLVIVISSIYLIYWSNSKYLSGYWWSINGRLQGPANMQGGIYKDENEFAMFFVTSLPFLFYLGFYLKNRILKYAIWVMIPLGWHAVFLTASRGGILGVVATVGMISLRISNKLIGILMLTAFVLALIWQGGDTLKRRSQTISSYQTESSARTRLEAWGAAYRMIKGNPVFGVGLASFGPAFEYYSDKQPRETHNTFLQIMAENGVTGGMMYALIAIIVISTLWMNGPRLKKYEREYEDFKILYLVNESLLVSFTGLLICSFFLSLQYYEIYYYLLVVANTVMLLSSRALNTVQPHDHKN